MSYFPSRYDYFKREETVNVLTADSLGKQLAEALDEIDALKAAQADARRYRWLRDNDGDGRVIVNWNVGHDWMSTENLDAAIDAAITQSE
jgi:hypothetical protein